MIFALDYDGTYTREPILWKKFIADAKKLSHVVICFTMRRPDEVIRDMPCEIVYTSRKAKLPFSEANGYKVDIWIDDKPAWLLEDSV